MTDHKFTYMRNNLKVQRAIKNITQAELARRIGVSRQTINAIESQDYVPSTRLALLLSHEFKLPVNEIFFLESMELPQYTEDRQSSNGFTFGP